VTCVQPAANLIPCLLEPQSEFGFIRYWKYGLVPDTGGVFPVFRYTGKTAPSVIPYKPWRSSCKRALRRPSPLLWGTALQK